MYNNLIITDNFEIKKTYNLKYLEIVQDGHFRWDKLIDYVLKKILSSEPDSKSPVLL